MCRLAVLLIVLFSIGCQRNENVCVPFKKIADNPEFVSELERWVSEIHATGEDGEDHEISAPNMLSGEYALNFDSLTFKSSLPEGTQARAIVEPGGSVSAIYLGTGYAGLVIENSDREQSQVPVNVLTEISERTDFLCAPRD